MHVTVLQPYLIIRVPIDVERRSGVSRAREQTALAAALWSSSPSRNEPRRRQRSALAKQH